MFQWLYETEGENSIVPAGTVRYIFSGVATVEPRAGRGATRSARSPRGASAEIHHRLFMTWLLLVLGFR
jgi:hypothetical protein